MNRKLFEWVMGGIGFFVLLLTTLYIALHWRNIPDMVPSHFNAAGAVDAYGRKGSLWMLLVFGWLLYAVLSLPPLFSGMWRGAGSPRAIRAARWTLAGMGPVMALGFSYICLCSALCRDLGGWFLPVFLVLLFAQSLAAAIFALRR